MLGHWLGVAQGKHNFSSNSLMNPEKQQLELSVSYFPFAGDLSSTFLQSPPFGFKIQYIFKSLERNHQRSLTATHGTHSPTIYILDTLHLSRCYVTGKCIPYSIFISCHKIITFYTWGKIIMFKPNDYHVPSNVLRHWENTVVKWDTQTLPTRHLHSRGEHNRVPKKTVIK